MRIKAIYCALKFGILPYWCYEQKRHYKCSYIQHLLINTKYAFRWFTFRESENDIQFEKETNHG